MNEMNSVYNEIYRATEQELYNQLSEYVSRGIIGIEQQEPVLVHDQTSCKVSVQMKIKLVPKELEYIKKLEEENLDLKNRLKAIKESIDGE